MGKSTTASISADNAGTASISKRNLNQHKHARRWNKGRRFKKNLWNQRHVQMSTNVSAEKLKKLHVHKSKEKKVHLNKAENVFNLSRLTALNKKLMDDKQLHKEKLQQQEEEQGQEQHGQQSPSQMGASANDTCIEMQDAAIKLSSLPNTFKPGSVVQIPQKISCRSWKSIQHQHLSKLQEFNPRSQPTFTHSMYYKKERNATKEVENLLRDEIRAEKQLEARKKKQREEMRKLNEMRGMVVKPIRNMHKLKKFSKKQWKTVMKAHVDIHNPKNAVRSSFVARQ